MVMRYRFSLPTQSQKSRSALHDLDFATVFEEKNLSNSQITDDRLTYLVYF